MRKNDNTGVFTQEHGISVKSVRVTNQWYLNFGQVNCSWLCGSTS